MSVFFPEELERTHPAPEPTEQIECSPVADAISSGIMRAAIGGFLAMAVLGALNKIDWDRLTSLL